MYKCTYIRHTCTYICTFEVPCMKNTTRLVVDIPHDLHRRLKARAVDEDTTVSSLVRAALQGLVEDGGRKDLSKAAQARGKMGH